MSRIGIIGALQVEIDLLLNAMEVKQEINYAGFPFFTGKMNGEDIMVTRCGVGKVNAAACTQLLINQFKVDYIINTGIAGSLREDVQLLDMVISSDVVHHDVRKAQMKNLFPFQEAFLANEQLVNLAKEACMGLGACYHIGRIVSGESFVDSTEVKENICKNLSAHCVEMEGSSVGHVAFINNIPFIVIRCISDFANEEAVMDYKDFEQKAGHQSAAIVLSMIRNFRNVSCKDQILNT